MCFLSEGRIQVNKMADTLLVFAPQVETLRR
jgi:hypothetical protein